jgi:hypothetical protein
LMMMREGLNFMCELGEMDLGGDWGIVFSFLAM